MKPKTAGYSGTPLAKKLGISDGTRLLVENAPDDYAVLLSPMPTNVTLQESISGETDIVHVFSERKSALNASLKRLRKSIKDDGVVWVSWPKKASKIQTDLTENSIREFGLQNDLVDIKVCAVNEVWSGLKFVYRLQDR